MENKINIVELLKDCPTGMELDCTMYNKVTLLNVDTDDTIFFPISVVRKDGNIIKLTKYGQYSNVDFAKCIIFPKNETTWEGFHRPFKDGDILFVKSAYSWVLIYKESESEEDLYKYVAIQNYPNPAYIIYDNNPLCCKEDISKIRFATEEEKQKLFQAIKDNGYRWDEETKTLEKLIPKFKVGDKITPKDFKDRSRVINAILDNEYNLFGGGKILFSDQDNWELSTAKFDITTLKPFDKVLMRSSNAREWVATFYSHYSNNKFYGCGMCCDQCIPYEGNEHLLGTTDDCDEYFNLIS